MISQLYEYQPTLIIIIFAHCSTVLAMLGNVEVVVVGLSLVSVDQNESYCPNIVCYIPYHHGVVVVRGVVAAVDVVVGSSAVGS